MEIRCILEFKMETEERAKAIAESVKVDDENYVKTDISGSTIIATIKAKDVGSLTHTVDDYTACISIAEKSLKESN